MDYRLKSYGRNDEVRDIFDAFDAASDISLTGPRRLGKTFLLDRIVDGAQERGWTAVKTEVAGCQSTRDFFRELCRAIGSSRTVGEGTVAWIRQRFGQVVNPRSEDSRPWYEPLLSTDHQTYFELLVKMLHGDQDRRWALLVDELPIFLKSLHDSGEAGIRDACAFMNLTSRLRATYPEVRWMITGSIGLEPLARAGSYLGVLAKYEQYSLGPLEETQAKDFVRDLALAGRLRYRTSVTEPELQELVAAVGWRAAYYLEALAKKLQGSPAENPDEAKQLVEAAVGRLIQPSEQATFGVWEEHLNKHYLADERKLAFEVLGLLARVLGGLSVGTLLTQVNKPGLTEQQLQPLLTRLHMDGFLTVVDVEKEAKTDFQNPLLRAWWKRFQPQPIS